MAKWNNLITEDKDCIALIGSDCCKTLRENIYDKETEAYKSMIGVRQGEYEDDNTLIFTLVNPRTKNFWELKVEDSKWFNIEKAEKDAGAGGDYEGENVVFVLQLYLREILFPMIEKQTEFGI